MLKCSCCRGPPLKQCIECEGKLFCAKCSQDHISFHEANLSKCNFEAIRKKFSEEKMSKLKKSIQEYIAIINIQKNHIIKESSKTIQNIEKIVKSSLEQLDKMIEEYETFSKLEIFGLQDILIAEEFLKRQLVFEYPSFTKVKGMLIKNSKITKTYGEQPNELLINSKYNLFIQNHTGSISSLAISNDNRYLVSGSSDKTLRIWNLLEKNQLSICQGHTESISSIAISNDNQFIFSGSMDTTIRVWNFHEKNSKAILKGHASGVLCIVITSDNKILISGSCDTTIKIWSLFTKSIVSVLGGHSSWVNSISLSKDNQILVSGSKDISIKIWNLSKKTLVANLYGHFLCVNAVVLSNNGEFIVSASDDKTLRIWDSNEFTQKNILTGHEYHVSTLSITSDDKYAVSGSEDFSVRIWNLIEKRQEAIYKNCSSIVKSIRLTTNDQFVVLGSENRTLKFFALHEKLQETIIQKYMIKLSSIAKTKNNKFIVTGNTDNIIRVWKLCKENTQSDHKNCINIIENDVAQKNCMKKILDLESKTVKKWELNRDSQGNCGKNQRGIDWITAVLWENGFVIKGFCGGIAKICELFKQKEAENFQGHYNTITSVAIMKDNNFAASSSKDCTVRLWDLIDKRQDAVFMGHEGVVWKVVISKDNKFLVSGSEDKTVRLWNISQKRLEAVLEGHTCPVKSLLVQNENQFASVSDGELFIWNIQECKSIARLPVYTVYAFNETVKSCIAYSSEFNAMLLWNIKEKYQYKLLKKCNITEDYITTNNNCFLTQQSFGLVSGNHILIWSLLNDKQVTLLKGHTKNITCITVSKDNSLLVSGSEDMKTKVWDIRNKQLKVSFGNHSDYVSTVGITNDNNFVVSGSYDMTIAIWDLTIEKIKHILKGHYFAISLLVLSNDNKYLISFSWDKTLRVWNIDNGKDVKIITFQSEKVYVAPSNDSKFIVTATSKSLINVIYYDKNLQGSHIQGFKSEVNKIELTFNNKFTVVGYDDFTIGVYNLFKKKLEIRVTLKDNRIPRIFVSQNSDKVYIATGFGVSSLNIDKKVLRHKMFFDRSVEEYFTDEFEDKSSLMPEISRLG